MENVRRSIGAAIILVLCLFGGVLAQAQDLHQSAQLQQAEALDRLQQANPQAYVLASVIMGISGKSAEMTLDNLCLQVETYFSINVPCPYRRVEKFSRRLFFHGNIFDLEILENNMEGSPCIPLPRHPEWGMRVFRYDREDFLDKSKGMVAGGHVLTAHVRMDMREHHQIFNADGLQNALKESSESKKRTILREAAMPETVQRQMVSDHILRLNLSEQDVPSLARDLARRLDQDRTPQYLVLWDTDTAAENGVLVEWEARLLETFIQNLLPAAALDAGVQQAIGRYVSPGDRARVQTALAVTRSADNPEKGAFWVHYLEFAARRGTPSLEHISYLGRFIGYFYGEHPFQAEELIQRLNRHVESLSQSHPVDKMAARVLGEAREVWRGIQQHEDAIEGLFRSWGTQVKKSPHVPSPLVKAVRDGHALHWTVLEGDLTPEETTFLKEYFEQRSDLPEQFSLEVAAGSRGEFWSHGKPVVFTIPPLALAASALTQKDLSRIVSSLEDTAKDRHTAWVEPTQKAMVSLPRFRAVLLDIAIEHELGHYHRQKESKIIRRQTHTFLQQPPEIQAYWLVLLGHLAGEGVPVRAFQNLLKMAQKRDSRGMSWQEICADPDVARAVMDAAAESGGSDASRGITLASKLAPRSNLRPVLNVLHTKKLSEQIQRMDIPEPYKSRLLNALPQCVDAATNLDPQLRNPVAIDLVQWLKQKTADQEKEFPNLLSALREADGLFLVGNFRDAWRFAKALQASDGQLLKKLYLFNDLIGDLPEALGKAMTRAGGISELPLVQWSRVEEALDQVQVTMALSKFPAFRVHHNDYEIHVYWGGESLLEKTDTRSRKSHVLVEGKIITIASIYMDPMYQGLGIGRKIVEMIRQKYPSSEGYEIQVPLALETNQAVQFWRQMLREKLVNYVNFSQWWAEPGDDRLHEEAA